MNSGPQPDPSESPANSPATTPASGEGNGSAGTPSSGDAIASGSAVTGGPLAAVVRGKGPLAIRGSSPAKPASPQASIKPGSPAKGDRPKGGKPPGDGIGGVRGARPASAVAPQGTATGDEAAPEGTPLADSSGTDKLSAPPHADRGPGKGKPGRGRNEEAIAEKQPPRAPKAAVPNVRQPLSVDLQAELERELASAVDLEAFLAGNAGMALRKEPLEDGQRVHATVLKSDEDGVFVALGGPDQGVIPLEQFSADPPAPGTPLEVIVRGLSKADGLYQLTIPGETISVTDWSDLDTGSIVEATITAANTGGLECTVAGIRGFMPISQIAEHRVENAADYVGKKLTCVITEANPRRGNLVVSHRAILERERESKRQEQLEKIEVGDLLEGVVGTVKDFGAFVDLGGLEGLIHVSKLSWERIKHPSEVIEPGQRVKVKVEKIDKQTGKISLSYRDLLENPWDAACASLAPGSVITGTITRIAAFGAFVRIAPGVEGLVHVSEIAPHRVSNVASFLNEGQEVQAKVLTIDRDSQKISLSIKQAHHKAPEAKGPEEDEGEVEARQPAVKATHTGPLRGGNNQPTGGEKFGLRW